MLVVYICVYKLYISLKQLNIDSVHISLYWPLIFESIRFDLIRVAYYLLTLQEIKPVYSVSRRQ